MNEYDKNYNNLKLFSNINEELEFYKANYNTNIKELLKCQMKIKNLECSNNILKEKFTKKIQNNSYKTKKNNNINNLSDIFISRKEFKNQWETIIKTELIEVFEFCISDYTLISNLCQDIIMIVYNETKNIINYKYNDILKCVNLEKISNKKKDEFYNIFLPFFQENFKYIFSFDENSVINTNKKLLSIILEYDCFNKNTKSKNNNELKNILINKINNNYFQNLYKKFYCICIYMLLHEPILTFNIVKYSERKLEFYFYNEKEFINVEGFGDDKTPCIIVLPPPLIKNNYPFNGIRPAVYCISENNKDIMSQCRKKNNNNDKNFERNIPIINFEGIKKLSHYSKLNNLNNNDELIKKIDNKNKIINLDKFSNSFKMALNNYKNKSKIEKDIINIFKDNSINYLNDISIKKTNNRSIENNIDYNNKNYHRNFYHSEEKTKKKKKNISKNINNINNSIFRKYKIKNFNKIITSDAIVNSELINKSKRKSQITKKNCKKIKNLFDKLKNLNIKNTNLIKKNKIKKKIFKENSERNIIIKTIPENKSYKYNSKIKNKKNFLYNKDNGHKMNININFSSNECSDNSNNNFAQNLFSSYRYNQKILNEKNNKKIKNNSNNSSNSNNKIIIKKIRIGNYLDKKINKNNKYFPISKKMNILQYNNFIQSTKNSKNIISNNHSTFKNNTFNLLNISDSNLNNLNVNNNSIKYISNNNSNIFINNITQNSIHNYLRIYDYTPVKGDSGINTDRQTNFMVKKKIKNNSILVNYLKKKNNKNNLFKNNQDDEFDMIFRNNNKNNSEFLKNKKKGENRTLLEIYKSLNIIKKQNEFIRHKKCNSEKYNFLNVKMSNSLSKRKDMHKKKNVK